MASALVTRVSLEEEKPLISDHEPHDGYDEQEDDVKNCRGIHPRLPLIVWHVLAVSARLQSLTSFLRMRGSTAYARHTPFPLPRRSSPGLTGAAGYAWATFA